MGVRVSSSTHGMLLALRCMRCIVINAFFLGITRIALIYGICIQWCLYEATRIWKLKVPLGIGRNLFCLTFLLLALCAVNSLRFRLLYKASREDHLPHPLALEPYRSSKFFHFPWTKKMPPESWALQLMQRERRLKILLFFDWTKKKHSPLSTRNCS